MSLKFLILFQAIIINTTNTMVYSNSIAHSLRIDAVLVSFPQEEILNRCVGVVFT